MLRKTFLITCILFCLIAPAEALQWQTTNQITIGWDAVTMMDNGEPIPADNTVKYRIYMTNATTDPDKTNPVVVTETDQLQHTLTINTEGKYIVGIASVRYDAGGVEVSESVVNWSDVNGELTPNPFGLVHYVPLLPPTGLHVVTP